MANYTRKLQYVAGTTYSLSLPKQWIQENNIKIGDELNIKEGLNKTLTISQETQNLEKEITLDITNHFHDIKRIINSIYYLGMETIHIIHRKEFPRELRLEIHKTINQLSGTEIIHEENNKLTIKVLLNKSKIDIYQLFYRLHLIIDSQFDEILKDANVETIQFYEEEIDRLYHLVVKIINMSLVDTSMLKSSKIENIQFIPSFFLLSKRLENISDNIEYIAKRVMKKNISLEQVIPTINLLRSEMKRNSTQLLRIHKDVNFTTMNKDFKSQTQKNIKLIHDKGIQIRLWEIQRFIFNIQEELVSLTFYIHQFQEK